MRSFDLEISKNLGFQNQCEAKRQKEIKQLKL